MRPPTFVRANENVIAVGGGVIAAGGERAIAVGGWGLVGGPSLNRLSVFLRWTGNKSTP